MSYKVLDTAVIGLLNIIGKITGRKCIIISMICYAFAAYAFPAAWFITAVTYFLVLAYLTFHIRYPLLLLLARCIPLEFTYYCLGNIGNMVTYLFKVAYYIKKDYT